MEYPFSPKSTAYLEPGHFWVFPLSNGENACGIVLQLQVDNGKRHSRIFLAGLIDWTGKCIPTPETLSKSQLINHGGAHVKTIQENGSQIIGKLNMEESQISIPLTLDQASGKNCRLQSGFDILGFATPEQQQNLNVFSTWGYGVIKLKAEKYLVSQAD